MALFENLTFRAPYVVSGFLFVGITAVGLFTSGIAKEQTANKEEIAKIEKRLSGNVDKLEALVQSNAETTEALASTVDKQSWQIQQVTDAVNVAVVIARENQTRVIQIDKDIEYIKKEIDKIPK